MPDMSMVGIPVEGATVLRNGILNEGEAPVRQDAGSCRRRPQSLLWIGTAILSNEIEDQRH